MKKHILCFGDSNTYGCRPSGGRYDESVRWPTRLQSLLGEEAWTGGSGSFIWTQEKIDETIALYESILEDIKNGILYSKSVDGQDDVMLSYNPADISTSAD